MPERPPNTFAPGEAEALLVRARRVRMGVPTGPVDPMKIRRAVFRILFKNNSSRAGYYQEVEDIGSSNGGASSGFFTGLDQYGDTDNPLANRPRQQEDRSRKTGPYLHLQ
jgi:hypothetical protein